MDYYYDDYDVAEFDITEDYDKYVDNLEEENLFQGVLNTCIKPSVEQILKFVSLLIAGNLLYRLLWYTAWRLRLGLWINHISSMFCGFIVLFYTTGYEFLIVLFLSLLAYVLILLAEYKMYKRIGMMMTVATITAHFLYESLWKHPEAWQRIRGIQMVATMKVISLAFDLEHSDNNSSSKTTGKETNQEASSIPGLLPFLGYIFCPATCVLGPWITYSCYLESIQRLRYKYRWILWTTLNALLSITFLCLSNCLVPLLCTDSSTKWVVTYRDALSVRCSHYFISFVSQATLVAGGVSWRSATEPTMLLGHMVTKPWHIEFPRSLSALVRSWNIPMHDFLKYYIFRSLRYQSGSYPLALIGTYMVSSLLHGLHFKIYMVLLSLAIFAYTESAVRLKLSRIFNACISANPCEHPCRYALCSSHSRWMSAICVWFANLFFSLLTILHLAYLGILLSSTSSSDTDNLVSNVWEKWANLNFLSHWITLCTVLFNYLI